MKEINLCINIKEKIKKQSFLPLLLDPVLSLSTFNLGLLLLPVNIKCVCVCIYACVYTL